MVNCFLLPLKFQHTEENLREQCWLLPSRGSLTDIYMTIIVGTAEYLCLYTKITWPFEMVVLLGSYVWPFKMDINQSFRQLKTWSSSFLPEDHKLSIIKRKTSREDSEINELIKTVTWLELQWCFQMWQRHLWDAGLHPEKSHYGWDCTEGKEGFSKVRSQGCPQAPQAQKQNSS